MTTYNQAAQMRLREKLDYELWLLDFLSNTEETFTGGKELSTITLMNRQAGAHTELILTDSIGSRGAMEVMNAMSPLTFTASYKILDVIFEWILEENYTVGNIKDKIPWEFSKKIEKIKDYEPQLIYPPLIQSEPYIKDYLLALYDNLLKFRNEIIHNNKFSVTQGKLKVTAIKKGQLYTLELDQSELGAFVRIAVAVAYLLTGIMSFGRKEDRLLKYYLDQIQKLHGLSGFNQAKPLLVHVRLKVPIEEGIFPADLKFVRQEIRRIHPNADVLFTLEIIGLVNDEPCIAWLLPIDAVPETDLLELRSNSLAEYRTSLPEED